MCLVRCCRHEVTDSKDNTVILSENSPSDPFVEIEELSPRPILEEPVEPKPLDYYTDIAERYALLVPGISKDNQETIFEDLSLKFEVR